MHRVELARTGFCFEALAEKEFSFIHTAVHVVGVLRHADLRGPAGFLFFIFAPGIL